MAGYHLVNIVLHALSACLVVRIAKRLSPPGAWLAGFIFALHPVCVEAVAWISEQKSTLSCVFYLASALAYLDFDRSRRRSHYYLALALFILALLSKTVTATLPAALLVVLWWQRGRLSGKRDVQPLLPWLAVGAAAGLFTAWVEKAYTLAEKSDFALTLVQRVLLAGRAICFYAGKLLWPVDLTFTYPHWKIDPAVWWQHLFPAAVVALAIGLSAVARRQRGPLAAFLIFAGTLFPVLGFLDVYPFRFSYVADHFEYLASLGIIVPASFLLTAAAARISSRKLIRLAVPGLLLLLLGTLTWRQSAVYQDAETLYRATLARNPATFMGQNNLCRILTETGRLDEAIAHCEAALRIKPGYVEAHIGLGNAWAQMPNRLPDAEQAYEAALRTWPDSKEAHLGLGNVLAQLPGRVPDAIAEFQTALRIDPGYFEAHFNLAYALSEIPGRKSDAIAECEAAIRLRPDLDRPRELLQELRNSGR